MAFVFLLLGFFLVLIAVRDQYKELSALLKSEFTGPNNFLAWGAAFLILGALGYIRPVRPVVNAMVLLLILVLILANRGGFFTRFNEAIRGGASGASLASVPKLQPLPALTAGATVNG